MARIIEVRGRNKKDARLSLAANERLVGRRFDKIIYIRTVVKKRKGYLGVYQFEVR